MDENLNLIIESVSEGFPSYYCHSEGSRSSICFSDQYIYIYIYIYIYMRRFGECTSNRHNISVALDPHGI